MKRKTALLTISTLFCGFAICLPILVSSNTYHLSTEADDVKTLTLNSANAPTSSTSFLDSVSDTSIPYATLTYTNVKANANKLCVLEEGGTFSKDTANGLQSINVVFVGKLEAETCFTTMGDTYIYPLTSGVTTSLCGNYIKVTALSRTIIESITLTYGCKESSKCLAHNMGNWETIREATEYQEGLRQRSCSSCDYVESETIQKEPHPTHHYEVSTDVTTAYTKYTCPCGDYYYFLKGDQTEKEFPLYSTGDSTVTFTLSTFSDVTMTLDKTPITLTSENVTLSNLSKGYHTIAFTTENDLNVKNLDISNDGYLIKRNGVILERLPASIKDDQNVYHHSFNVYVATKTPNKYIRYDFTYVYSGERENYKANSTTNISSTRIRTAQGVTVSNFATCETDSSGVTTSGTEVEVLQSGEIHLAMCLEDPNGVNATDFIGGYHGDEKATSVDLHTYDESWAITRATSSSSKRVRIVDYVDFTQVSDMFAWGTSSNPDNWGTKVATHTGHFMIDATTGVKYENRLDWVKDNYAAGNSGTGIYMFLFTMKRNYNSSYVCEKVASLTSDGILLGEKDIELNISKERNELSTSGDLIGTVARYRSDHSYYKCDAEFKVLPDSDCEVRETHFKIRMDSQGDNKYYASFKPVGKERISAGDHWAVDVSYKIDYDDPSKPEKPICIHSLEEISRTAATVEEDGTITSQCSKCGETVVSPLSRKRLIYGFDSDGNPTIVSGTSKTGMSLTVGANLGHNSGAENSYSGTQVINSSTDIFNEKYSYKSSTFITIKGESQTSSSTDANFIKIVIPERCRVLFYCRCNGTKFQLSISKDTRAISASTVVGDPINFSAITRGAASLEAGTYYVSRYGTKSSTSSVSSDLQQLRFYGIEFIYAS